MSRWSAIGEGLSKLLKWGKPAGEFILREGKNVGSVALKHPVRTTALVTLPPLGIYTATKVGVPGIDATASYIKGDLTQKQNTVAQNQAITEGLVDSQSEYDAAKLALKNAGGDPINIILALRDYKNYRAKVPNGQQAETFEQWASVWVVKQQDRARKTSVENLWDDAKESLLNKDNFGGSSLLGMGLFAWLGNWLGGIALAVAGAVFGLLIGKPLLGSLIDKITQGFVKGKKSGDGAAPDQEKNKGSRGAEKNEGKGTGQSETKTGSTAARSDPVVVAPVTPKPTLTAQKSQGKPATGAAPTFS